MLKLEPSPLRLPTLHSGSIPACDTYSTRNTFSVHQHNCSRKMFYLHYAAEKLKRGLGRLLCWCYFMPQVTTPVVEGSGSGILSGSVGNTCCLVDPREPLMWWFVYTSVVRDCEICSVVDNGDCAPEGTQTTVQT